MKRFLAILAYSAAGLTVAVAVLAPFLWLNVFTNLVAKAGLRIDPLYTGGEPARTLARDGYQIVVHKPVPRRTLLARESPFVQIVFQPAAALPKHVFEQIDLNGDGEPDASLSFDVPHDPHAELRVEVAPRNGFVAPMHNVGKESFSSLIARVNDAIVVRVPLTAPLK
jgi:hypothetical protein